MVYVLIYITVSQKISTDFQGRYSIRFYYTFNTNHFIFTYRLLLRLPPLRALEPQVLEELFFAGLIGQVQIDSVIPYILRMGNNSGKTCICYKNSYISIVLSTCVFFSRCL